MKMNWRTIRLLAASIFLAAMFAGCAGTRGTLQPIKGDGFRASAVRTLAKQALIDTLEAQGASVAVAICDMQGKPLFLHDATRLMQPVSVQKLGLAADVLLQLSPDYRWQTRILADGPIVDGVLRGNLILLGGWDPSLSGDFPYSDWPWKKWNEAAKHLSKQGLQRIDGNIIGVGDLFTPGGWEAGDLIFRYAPAVSQLMWNDGVVTSWAGMLGDTMIFDIWPDTTTWSTDFSAGRIRPMELPPEMSWNPDPTTPNEWQNNLLWPGMNKAGYLAVPDPRALAVDAFRVSLRRAGVQGGDSTRVAIAEGFDAEKCTNLLTISSAPLDSVLKPMLAVSSNGWAEQIGATVNTEVRGVRPADPLWPSALDSLGVNPRGLRAMDACGMARADNLSAQTLLDLLIAARNRWGDRWTGLFVKPGDLYSTLQDRLEEVQPYVLAKTGSASRNRSLAGYILRDGKPLLAFVVMVNNSPEQPNRFIDNFITRLALRCNGEE